MEWKFRKDFQILPGIKLSYGQEGVKTTFYSRENHPSDENFIAEKLKHQLLKPYDPFFEIKSSPIQNLTSKDLLEFKNILIQSGEVFEQTQTLLLAKKSDYLKISGKFNRANKSLFQFLLKKKIARLHSELAVLEEEVAELREQFRLSSIRLEIDSGEVFAELYRNVRKAFLLLIKSEKKWDFTSSRKTNRIAERTSASSTITRSEVSLSEKNLPIIEWDQTALCFHNINGGDLYLYPGFIIIYESKTEFAIVNYSELATTFRHSRFIETEKVPADSKIIDHTWYKVNKDGSPDRRFSSNYQIPIAQYGEIHFNSLSGLNELYCFSNAEYAMLFQKALFDYVDAITKSQSLLNHFKA